MKCRVDLVLGSLRAAELINEYRQRLREQDFLPDKAALAIACEAYADACVYVLAAPGQYWTSSDEANHDPQDLQITALGVDPLLGHYAGYKHPCGTYERIPLELLDAEYTLDFEPHRV